MRLSAILIICFLMPLFVSSQESEPLHEPLIHVIASDKVRDIMQHLNDLVSARGMTALQVMELRVRHLKDLIATVDKLVLTSEELTDAIPGIRMSPENKIIFEALAKKLQEEAAEMKDMAEDTNYVGMEPAYQRLNSTCDACHQLFRF